jgi:hypothetical protein
MSYIYPAPGVSTKEIILRVAKYESGGDYTAAGDVLTIPALQDITVNAANDIFTWTQLDAQAKKNIATTATNSLSMNLVLDQDRFFGSTTNEDGSTTNAAGTTGTKGIFGLSTDKDLVVFDLYLGDTSDGAEGKFITGTGYITGLAPTVSADAPVWVSPITITVDGDYTIGTSATLTRYGA